MMTNKLQIKRDFDLKRAGDETTYILNSDGTYSDSYENMLLQEVSIGDKLHIGSSVIQLNEQQKNNFYGFYLGPNNPNNGNIDLYSIPPIDRLDYAGKIGTGL